LVVLDIDTAQNHPVHLNSVDGPIVELRELPYSLDTQLEPEAE
jgi:hypothetical protein